MKKTLAKTLRSALALVLALVMVLGTVGTTFAAELPEVSRDDVTKAVEKLTEVLKQYGPDVVKEAYNYAVDHGYVEAVKETAAVLKAEVVAYAEAYNVEKAHIEAALEALKSELKALKDDAATLAELVAAKKEELKDVAVENKEEAKAALVAMEAALKTLNEKVDLTEDLVADTKAAVAEMDAELTTLVDAVKKLESGAKAIISILKNEALLTAEAAKEEYIKVRDALFTLLGKVDKAYTYIDDLAADLIDFTATAYAEVKELAKFIASDLKETASNITDEQIAAAVEKVSNATGVSEETIYAVASKLKEKAPVAIEKMKSVLKTLKAAAKKAYKEATTDDYVINYDSYYVAIGDDTANADNSYADLLAAELGVKYDKSMTGANLIQDTVLDAEKIAKADLITIGYSSANFVGSVADAILGAEVQWANYLPEAGVKAVDVAMDEVAAYVKALGFGDGTAKALIAAIENIAFNSLAYAYKLPATISAIRDINEDAVVVVVGLDNPLENCSVSYNGKSVGVDKLMDSVLALTDLYSLCYAVLASNCIVVDRVNAPNDVEDQTVDVTDFVTLATREFDTLLPNAEGQEYIKTRIYDALRIKIGYLWGDANLDGKVNYLDALIICQYSIDLPVTGGFIYLPVCDVSDDNKYGYLDALYICQKSIDIIEKFPVEG